MKENMLFIIISLLFLSLSCSVDRSTEINHNTDTNSDICAIVNPNVKYQTIDHFGASDCWNIQHFSRYASESLIDKAADYLFSLESDDQGNPCGIGLSVFRFNIGSGSLENPYNHIGDKWRQTPCMINSQGIINLGAQQPQINFLKKARDRGCENFIGFCNSAPYFWNYNQQSYNGDRPSNSLNLMKDKYKSFASFLVNIVKNLKDKEGIVLNYISPFNEPEWDWTSPFQEGTPASLLEMSEFYRVLDNELTSSNLSTWIVGPESGQLQFLYSEDPNHSLIDNQIEGLFNIDSKSYIGDLKHFYPSVSGHGYWTDHLPLLIDVRKKLYEKLKEYNIGYWQSELCMMSNDTEVGGGWGKDYTMKTALYVARIIYHDLTIGNASSWQWWLALSTGDYKDGLLYTDSTINSFSYVDDTKLLWSLGNFSRFIRPGAVRIDVSGQNVANPHGVMVCAFSNLDGSIVLVALNYSRECSLRFKIEDCANSNADIYCTSDQPGYDLRYLGKTDVTSPVKLPARSVTTFVIH